MLIFKAFNGLSLAGSSLGRIATCLWALSKALNPGLLVQSTLGPPKLTLTCICLMQIKMGCKKMQSTCTCANGKIRLIISLGTL